MSFLPDYRSIPNQSVITGVLTAFVLMAFTVPIAMAQPAYTDSYAGTSPEATSIPANPQPMMESSGNTTALTAGTGASIVPSGTFLQVVFNSKMDARITETGEPFQAYLASDFKDMNNGLERIILPKGTVIRGRVDKVQRPGYFSRGGAIFLTFDHAMAPSGELIPLKLNLSTQNTEVNKQGALYADPGIPTKLKDSVNYGVDTFSKSVDLGVEAGKDVGDGLGSIITVPVAVAGGAVVGTLMTTGKAAAAVVGKGDTVTIDPGDSVTIDFGGSFVLPSE